jgi:hypothetical protein
VRRARELIPVLKERAVETKALRRIPDATVAGLKAAQLHNLFTPARYGGLELDWPVHVDVGRKIARGCGSTAWFATVVLCNTWLLGRFPEKAQDEAWSENRDLVAASSHPAATTESACTTRAGVSVSFSTRRKTGLIFLSIHDVAMSWAISANTAGSIPRASTTTVCEP